MSFFSNFLEFLFLFYFYFPTNLDHLVTLFVQKIDRKNWSTVVQIQKVDPVWSRSFNKVDPDSES